MPAQLKRTVCKFGTYVKKKTKKLYIVCLQPSFIIPWQHDKPLPPLWKAFCPWGTSSEPWASSKYELQGSLDVTICGLQRPQHQLLILDPHVPELLHLGLPAALTQQKHIYWMTLQTEDQPESKAQIMKSFTAAEETLNWYHSIYRINRPVIWDSWSTFPPGNWICGIQSVSPAERTCWRLAELAAEPDWRDRYWLGSLLAWGLHYWRGPPKPHTEWQKRKTKDKCINLL